MESQMDLEWPQWLADPLNNPPTCMDLKNYMHDKKMTKHTLYEMLKTIMNMNQTTFDIWIKAIIVRGYEDSLRGNKFQQMAAHNLDDAQYEEYIAKKIYEKFERTKWEQKVDITLGSLKGVNKTEQEKKKIVFRTIMEEIESAFRYENMIAET